ncbi:hypothetical protein J6590_021681 [Homalodisca vitripennis]|nr:hypothetical protein J6590_021681 [Homalodisca vitripennis]
MSCPFCKKEILRRNFDRHYNSKIHLKNKDIYYKELNHLRQWAKENQIDDHEKMFNIEQLRELKRNFKVEKKNLNLFNDEKINSITEKLAIETNDKTKSEMIEEIDKHKSENIIDVEVLSSIHETVILDNPDIRTQDRALRGAGGYRSRTLSRVINNETEPEYAKVFRSAFSISDKLAKLKEFPDTQRNKKHHPTRIVIAALGHLDRPLDLYNDVNS